MASKTDQLPIGNGVVPNVLAEERPRPAPPELTPEFVARALLANPNVERLTGLQPSAPTHEQCERFALNCARIARFFNEALPRPARMEVSDEPQKG